MSLLESLQPHAYPQLILSYLNPFTSVPNPDYVGWHIVYPIQPIFVKDNHIFYNWYRSWYTNYATKDASPWYEIHRYILPKKLSPLFTNHSFIVVILTMYHNSTLTYSPTHYQAFATTTTLNIFWQRHPFIRVNKIGIPMYTRLLSLDANN